jgi:hypothetical protein
LKNGKNERALGKGLDAILPKEIPKDVLKEESIEEDDEVIELEVRTKTQDVQKIAKTKRELISLIKKLAETKRSATCTDKFAIVYMHLLRHTIPAFNVSMEMGEIIRDFAEENNPELVRLIDEILKEVEE